MNGCSMLPVGDFLVQASEWTGKEPRELLALLRGSAPVSCGARPLLDRLAKLVRADAASAKLVTSGSVAKDVLAHLRGAAGELGEAARDYLDEVELRLVTGYDLGDRAGFEMPDCIAGAIRAAVAAPVASRADEETRAVAADTDRLRALVPEAHRAQFDEVLAEARFVYPMRDERGYYNDAVAFGLARRAVLEAGARLVAKGKLAAADHAVDLDPDELLAALAGKASPSRDEVAGRYTYRTTHTIADAPAHLGLPKSAPPPAEWLPAHAARTMRAVGITLNQMFDVPTCRSEDKLVRGLAASPGTYEGRARVIDGPEQFARVEKGDVLVTRMTSPSYNVLLPLLGGVVTDRGGLLSHAAIVAREYGLPAVVGTTDATRVIPDLARVRVDGTTGEVRVL